MSTEADPDNRARKIRRSYESLQAESPKKGSPFCYDSIQTWVFRNHLPNRAMYLSTMIRRSNLSLLESTWVWTVLSGRYNYTEMSILLSMPTHIRNAVQSYHQEAGANRWVLKSNRDPSELCVNPNQFSSSLDVAEEQFRVIFNVEESTVEVNACMYLLNSLTASGANPKDTIDRFAMCLLISLRDENPQMFCRASNVRGHVWPLLLELLGAEQKVATKDQSVLFSPGTIPATLTV